MIPQGLYDSTPGMPLRLDCRSRDHQILPALPLPIHPMSSQIGVGFTYYGSDWRRVGFGFVGLAKSKGLKAILLFAIFSKILNAFQP